MRSLCRESMWSCWLAADGTVEHVLSNVVLIDCVGGDQHAPATIDVPARRPVSRMPPRAARPSPGIVLTGDCGRRTCSCARRGLAFPEMPSLIPDRTTRSRPLAGRRA